MEEPRGVKMSEILQHHTTDFITAEVEEIYFENSKCTAKIAVTQISRSGSFSACVFVLLDTCAGIGASDAAGFFHGNATTCNYGVTGGAQAKEAPMSIGVSQPGATLLNDNTGERFIVRYGGSLRAEEGDLNETIFSVSQMLDAHIKSNGKEGAFMGEKSLTVHFPGHAVDVTVKDGLFGIDGTFLKHNDPLFRELDVAWASADGLYYPSKELHADVRKCVLDRPGFKVYAFSTTDNGDVNAVTKGVKTDLDQENIELTLKGFSHVAAMNLDTEENKRIWLARWGGLSAAVQEKMLDLNTSGAGLLAAEGRKTLKKLVGVPFGHPGSNFPRHKRATRVPRNGPLETYDEVAGDVLCADDCPTGLDKTPTFQVVADVALGTVGMVYENFPKADITQHLKGHFTNFVLPYIVVGDFAKQLHFGENQISCRDRLVQLKSSPPHHQWLNPAERHVFRVVNITTYIKLDSQLPDRFTMHCAKHACLTLMVSPVFYLGE
jgi:hypothetical protein